MIVLVVTNNVSRGGEISSDIARSRVSTISSERILIKIIKDIIVRFFVYFVALLKY